MEHDPHHTTRSKNRNIMYSITCIKHENNQVATTMTTMLIVTTSVTTINNSNDGDNIDNYNRDGLQK
jgi:hypothetical protein